jgi:hypothetical protein
MSFTNRNLTFSSEIGSSSFNQQDTIIDLDSLVSLNPSWFKFYQTLNADFDPRKFKFNGKRNVSEYLRGNIIGDFNKEFNKAHSQFLIDSPDGDQYIDLDYYQRSIEKKPDGQLICRGDDVDQEVNWVNRKTQKIYRIFFSGPDAWIEDAKWIDNSRVVLYGVDFKKLSIRIIDLQNHTSEQFQYQDFLPKMGNYSIEIRLQKVKFDY